MNLAETVLVLRTCARDMTSYGGFRWPESGPVSCPDWSDAAVCGQGLHGLLWGEGDGGLVNWSPDARWVVAEVAADAYVALDGKVKFPAGTVVFVGDQLEATTYLREHGGAGRAIVGGTSTSGDGGTSTSGDRGTSTSGDGGTIEIRWWDSAAQRYRTAVGYVGEDGIEPNVAYRLDDDHRFVAVEMRTDRAS